MKHNLRDYESLDGMSRHNCQRRKHSQPAVITNGMVFEPKETEQAVEQVEELDAFLSMFRNLPEEFDRITEVPEFDSDGAPIVQRLVEAM